VHNIFIIVTRWLWWRLNILVTDSLVDMQQANDVDQKQHTDGSSSINVVSEIPFSIVSRFSNGFECPIPMRLYIGMYYFCIKYETFTSNTKH
jgi:hypothetical protein